MYIRLFGIIQIDIIYNICIYTFVLFSFCPQQLALVSHVMGELCIYMYLLDKKEKSIAQLIRELFIFFITPSIPLNKIFSFPPLLLS